MKGVLVRQFKTIGWLCQAGVVPWWRCGRTRVLARSYQLDHWIKGWLMAWGCLSLPKMLKMSSTPNWLCSGRSGTERRRWPANCRGKTWVKRMLMQFWESINHGPLTRPTWCGWIIQSREHHSCTSPTGNPLDGSSWREDLLINFYLLVEHVKSSSTNETFYYQTNP